MHAAFEHRQTVRAKYVPAAKMTPDPLEFLNGDAEVTSLGGKHNRINCACRGSADYRKRIASLGRQYFGNRLEDADLKSTSGTASR